MDKNGKDPLPEYVPEVTSETEPENLGMESGGEYRQGDRD